MTNQEKVLLAIRVGRGNARTKKQLAQDTGLPERVVRSTIRDLILNSDAIICSSTGAEDGGYYIAETHEDVEKALRHLIPRIVAINERYKALQRKGWEKFGGQLHMEVISDAATSLL